MAAIVSHKLNTDYLIVGAGAVGLAFADVLLAETDASITIVDKHAHPGGHWNDAYSFVTLHQPAAYYGVSSLELSSGKIDTEGWNKGLHELASRSRILSYFEQVVYEKLLPSGRVRYLPKTEYLGEGKIRSILSGEISDCTVSRKIVDATYFKTSVPSTHTPNFSIANSERFLSINQLAKLDQPCTDFVVIGGGKTGIDAILWLLENRVPQQHIRWIMPRDAWLINRKNAQPTEDFFAASLGAQASQMEAIAQSSSISDLFERLEQAEVLLRIDSSVTPKMFHGATVSKGEVEALKGVENIIRLGRVLSIEEDKLVLEQGEIPCKKETLFVDCSASAVPPRKQVPVFTEEQITIQTVRTVQPVFSAAFIAHIEASYNDIEQQNKLCQVVPLPNHDTDWLRVTAAQMMNQKIWSSESGLKEWLKTNRLDGFTKLAQFRPDMPSEHQQILSRMKEAGKPAFLKLQQLIAQIHV